MKPSQRQKKNKSKRKRSLWFEKLMAILAVLDVGLVLFDLSYISWRNFYYRYGPDVIHQWYDPIKGIEPHRDTEQYLETVDELRAQVAATGINSEEVMPLLEELGDRSETMIDENPFQIADKTGDLERIKNRMRDRLNNESAKDAFQDFWSRNHLTSNSWQQEMDFFESEIRPQLEMNYFRSISIRGTFTDRFWQIDAYFILIFALEFLARTWTISRRTQLSWRDAWLFRWYDILLLVPFSGLGFPVFALTRLIPLAVRLDQSNLVDLKPLRRKINQGVVAALAGEITETVVIRVIDRLQDAIENDGVINLVRASDRQYIDINDRNEMEVLSQQLVRISLYEVFPEIKPDLEALLLHSLTTGVKDMPLYQNFQNLPGMQDQPEQLAREVIRHTTDSLYDVLKGMVEDPVGAELFNNMVQNFTKVMQREIGQPNNATEIQTLLSDFLEEMKINYFRRDDIEDIENFEAVIEETRQLREAAQKK
jgi:RNAse (barnase) inhibitor barstar